MVSEKSKIYGVDINSLKTAAKVLCLRESLKR